ncbi:hypothetical protein K523DRAFT_131663 [Schizophyllum commune Tattone D]|nr:hypothetical protein K523DRAFT_131663 [Schizophyllum commune Tattone D]
MQARDQVGGRRSYRLRAAHYLSVLRHWRHRREAGATLSTRQAAHGPGSWGASLDNTGIIFPPAMSRGAAFERLPEDVGRKVDVLNILRQSCRSRRSGISVARRIRTRVANGHNIHR